MIRTAHAHTSLQNLQQMGGQSSHRKINYIVIAWLIFSWSKKDVRLWTAWYRKRVPEQFSIAKTRRKIHLRILRPGQLSLVLQWYCTVLWWWLFRLRIHHQIRQRRWEVLYDWLENVMPWSITLLMIISQTAAGHELKKLN